MSADDLAAEGASSVKALFRGAGVFVTGATGFVGMAVLEKILRACPDVGAIFLLVRPKRGKSPADRLADLIKDPVFETLVEARGEEALSRLHAVSGDVAEEGLGLSADDRRRLADTVSVVIHAAASLDFESPLKSAVITNLLGTRRVVELCRELPKLKAMIHVSSAYVNSNRRDVDEILYPLEQDADKLIEMTQKLSEEALEALVPNLLGDLPNAYTLTKSLAENEVAKASQTLPCAIVRPSMITAAWKEPVPGWTNSKNGPTGFMMGAANGVVRRLPVNTSLICDYIPVDIVVNTILVAAWHLTTTSQRPSTIPVYHCTSSTSNPFRWTLVESHINDFLHRYPLKKATWYPHLKLLPSLTLFRIAAIFVHLLPAYILDFATRLRGGRPILVRLHTNVSRSLDRLAPFIFNEWHFNSKNLQALSKSLNIVDQQLFYLDISSLQWEGYFISLAQGVRRYLNKEHPSSLPSAIRKDKILFVCHIALQLLVFGSLWTLFASIFGLTMTKSVWFPVVLYILFCLI